MVRNDTILAFPKWTAGVRRIAEHFSVKYHNNTDSFRNTMIIYSYAICISLICLIWFKHVHVCVDVFNMLVCFDT